jgi:predicted transposase YbfD/YdcC
VAQIIDSGNDYLITLKANQGKLFKLLQAHFEQSTPLSLDCQVETTRGRTTERRVRVLAPPDGIDPAWAGIKRVVCIERWGIRGQKPASETMFYISSLTLNAGEFAERIRSHWHVENRLHWVKDVVMGEDNTAVCDGYALSNFAIVRSIVVNLFRANGFDSITKGIRHLAHDIHKLFSFFQ